MILHMGSQANMGASKLTLEAEEVSFSQGKNRKTRRRRTLRPMVETTEANIKR